VRKKKRRKKSSLSVRRGKLKQEMRVEMIERGEKAND
jgi:hypothetical protein